MRKASAPVSSRRMCHSGCPIPAGNPPRDPPGDPLPLLQLSGGEGVLRRSGTQNGLLPKMQVGVSHQSGLLPQDEGETGRLPPAFRKTEAEKIN